MSIGELKATTIIFAIVIIIFTFIIIHQENSIQNLEEKLNIYRESYEEFCLEDNKKQGGIN